jgi:hypothetical protein
MCEDKLRIINKHTVDLDGGIAATCKHELNRALASRVSFID